MKAYPKALIIDDEPKMCQTLEVLMENEGVEAQSCHTGGDALRMIEHSDFDVVLLDITLPDMNGHDVMHRIVALDTDTSVVILTGDSSADSAIAALKKGAFDYLRKPCNPDVLVKTVHNALEAQKEKRDRKRAEEALRKKTEEIEDILGSISDGFFTLDENLVVTYFNKAAADILGRIPDDVVGRELFEAFPEAKKSIFEEKYRLALNERKTLSFETYFGVAPYKNWYQVRVYPNMRGISIFFQVITGQKEAKEKLRKSEQKYRSLFDNALEMIHIVDSDGKIVDANKAELERMGYSRKEYLGKPLIEIIHPVFRAKSQNALRSVMSGKRIRAYETAFITKQGEKIDVEVNAVPESSNGDIIGARAIIRDLSERKQTEKALAASKALLDSTGRMARVGGWELDAETLNVRWTEETYNIHEVPFGYKPPLKEAISFFHPEDRKRLSSAIQRALDHGEPYDMEIRFITAKGRHLWTRTICEPQIVDGKTVKLLGTFQDITVRKQAEEELEMIFSMSLDLICIADINTATFRKVNPAFTQTLGYSEEELLASSFLDMIHPDDVQSTKDIIEKELKRGKKVLHFENRYRCKDGRYCCLSWTSHPLPERGVTFAVARDETERRKANEDLKKSEEKYRRLVENLEQEYFFYSHDTKGVFVYISPSITNILGYSQEEFLTHYTEYLTDNPLNKMVEYHSDLSAQGEKQPPYDVEILNKDGNICRLEVSETPIFDDEGNVVGVEGIAHDVTDRVRAEKTKRRLESQLQQAQKMEAIGTLAGGIAHDFNNILTPILIQTELAKMTVSEDAEVQTNLLEIMEAGHRAKELVKQILTFSRQSEQQHVALDPVPIFKETVKLLRSSIPKTIQIVESIEKAPGMVMADPTQLQQVVMNLCTNAAQAMMGMEGVLEVTLGRVELNHNDHETYSDINPGNYVLLKVNDTGPGIGPEIVNKIFDPFFTTKATGEGTGMGLTMVHGIVKSHGGTVSVFSEPGKGTTFEVLLPRIEKETESETKEAGQVLPKGTEKILFIDDEIAIAKLGLQMLEQLGYTVETMTSPIEALEAFQNHPDEYDLVMTDMTMPNITGEGLAQELLRIRPDMPIVICTGFSYQMDEKKAKTMGIRAFVMKPFVMKEVADTIRKVLDATGY